MKASKIFNDPVYGFITLNDSFIQKLLDHTFFQRLRKIGQLGLSHLVYPGAHHTRFHHALGAMHLMGEALEVLQNKGIDVSKDEIQAAKIAILLHDIGHGPFSHTLEHSILEGISHESISLEMMHVMNDEFDQKMTLAIQIFENKYHRKFFHQLVSSQLDVDRLDYLMRDSFYTGVAEGIIGSERIIKMMDVVDDELVVEEKGIYSIEKFLIARRLMYWQVYLHKTVIGAESLLLSILKRAKHITNQGHDLYAPSSLKLFLYNDSSLKDKNFQLLQFSKLDDIDILASIKEWCNNSDEILSNLCERLVTRKLLKVKLQTKEFDNQEVESVLANVEQFFAFKDNNLLNYYVTQGVVKTQAYDREKGEIKILTKKGDVKTLFEISDHLMPEDLTRVISKNFICYPKEIEL